MSVEATPRLDPATAVGASLIRPTARIPEPRHPPTGPLVTPEAANSPAPTAPLRPYAGRPQLPDGGLRLLPLDGFHWGGGPRPGMPRTARVRGDHCLIRVTAGTLRLIMPSGAVDHGADSVVFVPAGTAFATQPLPGAAGQVLLMPRQMAERLDVPLPARMVVGAGASDAFSADLSALAARTGDPIAAATAACRVELISAALQRMAGAPDTGAPARPGGETRSLFDSFTELAGRELGRGRTVADLAQALGTSTAGLDAACRTHRGRSALDVMYDLRLDRARALLVDPAQSLAQIAADLGFTGVAHLNRAFMAATGRTAEAFRPA